MLFAPVIRLAIVAALVLTAAASLPAVQGAPDPVFSTIPFDQWLNQPAQSRIHWTLHLSDPALTPHQRFAVSLDVQIDGAELSKRRGEGRFLVLVQLNDEENHLWQNHQELDLERIGEGVKASDAVFSQFFFVLPGNYRIAVAVFDTASGEHSVIVRTLHVTSLKNDPLPGMWRDLPPVEFYVPDSSPDRWYLPSIEGRLNLAVEARHPLEIDLMVNLTPAERLSGSTHVQNRNLEALIPAMKALTQVEWRNARLNLEVLDLARRRIAFRQDDVATLDWPKASAALGEANPGIIDVKSLRNRQFSADFFLNRIARHVRPFGQTPRPPRVVIVLSATVYFEPGMDIHPIQPAARPDATVIYIRYQPRPEVSFSPEGGPRRLIRPGAADQLEPLLKPLSPRLFDVQSPEQFRRSLATILDLVANL